MKRQAWLEAEEEKKHADAQARKQGKFVDTDSPAADVISSDAVRSQLREKLLTAINRTSAHIDFTAVSKNGRLQTVKPLFFIRKKNLSVLSILLFFAAYILAAYC